MRWHNFEPSPIRRNGSSPEQTLAIGVHQIGLVPLQAAELANVNAVVVEGHITSTPLLAHPLTERRQQSGIASRGLGRPQGNDPVISRVGEEQARTMDHFQPLRMLVVWAVASTQMAVESRKK